MERHETRHTRRWLYIACLLAVATAAFFLRSIGAGGLVSQGRTLFPGTDTYYHMRRIHKTVDDYPHVPTFDAYVNYPEGARIYWPAGFDLLLATVVRLSGCPPWSLAAERVCAWSIPALGTLVILATCWLGVLWRGWLVGLAAASLAAIVPSLVARSMAGRVDHDIAVILGATLAFASCAAGSRCRLLPVRVLLGTLGGGFLAWSLWAWPGSILFIPVIPAAFAAATLVGSPDGHRAAVISATAASCVGSVVVSLGGPGILSHAHLLVAVVCGLSPIVCCLIASRHGMSLLSRALLLAGAHVALLAIALLLLSGSTSDFRFLAGFAAGQTDTVVAQAGEARPLLAGGLASAAAQLTWAAAALPVAVLLLARTCLSRRGSVTDWIVLTWVLVAASAALLQQRFAAVLAVPMALVLADLLSHLWAMARSATLEVRPLLRLGATATLAAAACLPWTPSRWSPPTQGVELPRVLPALEWLRTRAPAGDVSDFQTRPTHGVVAHWHYGHWLTALAGQASVASPFGNTPQHQLGLDRVRKVFGADSEEAAAALCRETGTRFILSTDSFLPAVLMDLYGSVYGTPSCFASTLQSSTPPSRLFALRREWSHPAVQGRPLKTRLFELLPTELVPVTASSPSE